MTKDPSSCSRTFSRGSGCEVRFARDGRIPMAKDAFTTRSGTYQRVKNLSGCPEEQTRAPLAMREKGVAPRHCREE